MGISKERLSRPLQRAARRLPRRLVAPLGVWPDFLIIGAMKSGTTSLYEYLIRHPHVAPARRKEVHFFDRRLHRGTYWYRSYFPARHIRWLEPRVLTGEATPKYLYDCDIPELVSRWLPHVKLVALLRNPVDRAYSHYQMEHRSKEVSGEFEWYVRECRPYWPSLHCFADSSPPPNADAATCMGWICRGLYAEQLTAWLRYFPRQQMLVLNSERFFADPQTTLNRVTRYLGLDHHICHEYPTHNGTNYPPMNRKTRKELLDYFRPHNERLYELLGERFDWDQ